MKLTWSLPGHSGDGAIDGDVLNTPLPADRVFEEAGLTYGHYVRAVTEVLERGEGRLVAGLMKTLFPEKEPSLSAIHVAILKHGHFYHPACMTLDTSEGKVSLVINLAVTTEGGACARREFALLRRLKGRSEALPTVYALEEVAVDGHPVVLFVGEWFDDYHEFHQTRVDTEDRVVVWADGGNRLVSRQAEGAIYRQAAAILTRLYNPQTFELVQPWHHAAGDFVVNIERDEPRVRLITVRQYLPLADVEDVEAEDLLEGALFFLMLLSLRNRLDRYDGIGEVAWVGEHAVLATVDGFFEGVKGLCDVGPLEGPFDRWVARYLAAHSEEDLRDTAMGVVSSFNPRASEMGVIREHLGTHVALFHRAVREVNRDMEVK